MLSKSGMIFACPSILVVLTRFGMLLRHLHESQNIVNPAGGKTPFGAGGRTPARPGGATPGRMSVRQVGRTPNPYSASTPATFSATPASAYGAPPPVNMYGMTPRTPFGHQTPSYPPPNVMQPPLPIPPGMNPARAKLLQTNSTEWGQNSTWS